MSTVLVVISVLILVHLLRLLFITDRERRHIDNCQHFIIEDSQHVIALLHNSPIDIDCETCTPHKIDQDHILSHKDSLIVDPRVYLGH